LIEAQVKQSAEIFEQEMAEVLRIREHWQKVELRNVASEPEGARAAGMQAGGYAFKQTESRYGGWSV
jgi:hypothetical protein